MTGHDERKMRIVGAAKEHDDRYYLMRRYRGPASPPTDLDLVYDACAALVHEGYARWLGNSGPGIRLTGRQFTPPGEEEGRHDEIPMVRA